LSFDFRTFGGSEGLPRHLIDPSAQVDDYLAVVAHVRADSISAIDSTRVALWGTSFSGGAAICAAAQLAPPPSAVLLHVPYLGKPARGPGLLQMTGYVGLVMSEMLGDALARLIGVKLAPAYITAYGRPGEGAFGSSRDCPSRHSGKAGEPSCHPFWTSLPAAYRGGWRNRILARSLKQLDAIRPAKALAGAKFPVLVVAATDDDMIAITHTRELCRRAGVSLNEIPGGHFDPYVAPRFSSNLSMQAAFLVRTMMEWPIQTSNGPASERAGGPSRGASSR